MHDDTPARPGPPETPGTHRLFFALWPDDATRVAIAAAAARLRLHTRNGRWAAMARYHLTLQFLGTYPTMPREVLDGACAAAADTCAPAFSLTLDRVGSFRTHSHLWWLGCWRPDPLLPLREVLNEALGRHDLAVASLPFVPHVTLVRGASRPPSQDADFTPIVWPVIDFALIHSESGSPDAYRVVGRWPLATR